MSVSVLTQEDLQKSTDQIIAQEKQITGIGSALNTVITRVAALESEFNGDDAKIADLSKRLKDTEATVLSLESKLNETTSLLSSLNEKIASMAKFSDRLDNLESSFDSPTITFTANKNSIVDGDNAILTWDVKDAYKVTLDGKDISRSGVVSVSPSKNTDYVLTAFGPGKPTVSKRITVAVTYPAPTLTVNKVPDSVNIGESFTISWSTSGATKVNISGISGDLPANGVKVITPTANSSYVVTATGAGGMISQTVNVKVVHPLPTGNITVVPNIIFAGDSAKLSWNTTDADTVVITVKDVNGVRTLVGLDLAGSIMVNPKINTNYQLSMVGPGGTANQTVNLTVGPHP